MGSGPRVLRILGRTRKVEKACSAGNERGTEPTSEASGREQTERRLVERSLQDDTFRRSLLEDPKGVVEEELGIRLPEGVRVVALEETAETIYPVFDQPSRPDYGKEA